VGHDIIVLLTPFQAHHHVGTALDPFEYFGQALVLHKYKIRHVLYTTLDGIIGTHAYFIKRAAAVIFVMSVTNCDPRVKVLAAGKPLMVVMWNIPVLQEYSEPTLESMFDIVSLKR
jgi:hypothetical protein